MSQFEKYCAVAGATLLTAAYYLVRTGWNASLGERSGTQVPVERMADELKEAWSEHHSRA